MCTCLCPDLRAGPGRATAGMTRRRKVGSITIPEPPRAGAPAAGAAGPLARITVARQMTKPTPGR